MLREKFINIILLTYPNCKECPALRDCIKKRIFWSTDPNSSCVETRIKLFQDQQPNPPQTLDSTPKVI